MAKAVEKKCRRTNWSAYNKALKSRGSLSLWLDKEMAWFAGGSGKRGRSPFHRSAHSKVCGEFNVTEFNSTAASPLKASQADAYAGFNALYETGNIQEAACWAHVRRKFVDVYRANGAPIAAEAIARIATLYGIEAQIRGQLPAERRAARQAEARPRLHDLRNWLETQNQRVSRKSGIADAIGYALNQWSALMYYTTDGRVEIDTRRRRRRARLRGLRRRHGRSQPPRASGNARVVCAGWPRR